MAAPNLPDLELPDFLTAEQEMFCALVARGSSYRRAAIDAGVNEKSGSRWITYPAIRERISELVNEYKTTDLGGIANRAWIETKLVQIVNGLDDNSIKPEDYEGKRLQVHVLMNLARLKGLIVEKKQTLAARLNIGDKPDAALMDERIAAALDELEPGARQTIEARMKQLEARRAARPALPAPADSHVIETTVNQTPNPTQQVPSNQQKKPKRR